MKRSIPRPKNVSVIINPAAGKPEVILHTLNECLEGIRWTVDVTNGVGDARRFAEQALQSDTDLVISYGGDGTLMEVADGIAGSEIPILVLRGGTGNLIADELGTPDTLHDTLMCLQQPKVGMRPIDAGIVDDTTRFLLRCGCGLEAEALIHTRDEAKANWGKLAYVEGLLKSLSTQEKVVFKLWIDDATTPIEAEGIELTVANAGSIGWGKLKVAPDACISDQLLDVCFIKHAAIDSAVEFLKFAQQDNPGDRLLGSDSTVQYQQVRKIRVETDPVIHFQADGDLIGKTPFEAGIGREVIWVVDPTSKEY